MHTRSYIPRNTYMHKYSSKQPDTSINVTQSTCIPNLTQRLGIVGTTLCSEMFIILSDITPNVSPMTHCKYCRCNISAKRRSVQSNVNFSFRLHKKYTVRRRHFLNWKCRTKKRFYFGHISLCLYFVKEI